MHVIILSGASATGKTTIAMQLSEEFGLEIVSKDCIKERLFDTAGTDTRRFFWYENRAKRAFFGRLAKAIGQDTSVIIETNFLPTDVRRLRGMLTLSMKVSEIHCYVTGFVAFRRYVRRVEDHSRHVGHHDRRWYLMVFIETIWHSLGIRWPYAVTGLTPYVYEVNTTDFDCIDQADLTEFVRSRIAK